MGMNIVSKNGSVYLNWPAWSELNEILRAEGFGGTLPDTNDGHTVSEDTAEQVARALLKWYEKKRLKGDGSPPQLGRAESAYLAYGLILALEGGKAMHI